MVAYRTDIGARQRSLSIAIVAAIHALLFVLFLNLSGKTDVSRTQSALQVIELSQPVPPRAPAPRPEPPKKTRKQSVTIPGGVNSKSVSPAAPSSNVNMPSVQPVAATSNPSKLLTIGAAPASGPGLAAGGSGNGSGNGAGSGNGVDHDVAEPPRLQSPVLNSGDFPTELIGQWPRQATIFLRLRIDAQGYVAECLIDRATGVTAIDAAICNLAHQRLRFRPALNHSGQAVAGWFGYAQPAPR